MMGKHENSPVQCQANAVSPAERVTHPSPAQRALALALGVLLLAASLLKFWSDTRYPPPPHNSWTDSPPIAYLAVFAEAALGIILLAGLWPRPTWLAAVSTFSLFAIITAAETIQGKSSCGCFGVVQIRPAYTMCLDITAVTMLLVTGKPGRGSGVVGRGSRRRRWILATAIGVAWVGIVLGMYLTKPVIAVATPDTQGQTFGKPGELVVLEPEKWIGQPFSLANHTDIGQQLNTGQWIILLVHHDCDHCAAAVPRYVAAFGTSAALPTSDLRPTTHDSPTARLAVIEMPPFADANDPPPWHLPPSVLSGRLDQTRDWFATTPVALRLKDGIIISTKEGDAAETPGP